MSFPLGTSPCCGVASGHLDVRQPANCAVLRSTLPLPPPLGELHRPVSISTDMGPGVTAVPSTPLRHQGSLLLMDLAQGQAVVLYAAGQPQTVRPTAPSPRSCVPIDLNPASALAPTICSHACYKGWSDRQHAKNQYKGSLSRPPPTYPPLIPFLTHTGLSATKGDCGRRPRKPTVLQLVGADRNSRITLLI